MYRKKLILVLWIFFIFGKSILIAEEKSNTKYFDENDKIMRKTLDEREKNKEPLTGYNAEENNKRSVELNNSTSGNFWVLGGSIGSPASGNINVGYYFKDLVLRVSGMNYTSKWNGIQGDIGYSFWKTSVIAQSVSLVFGEYNVNPFNPLVGEGGQNKYNREGIIGYTNDPMTFSDSLIRASIASQNPDLATFLEYQYRTRQYAHFNQRYIGLTYDILIGGFFLQVGMGTGPGDYRNPILLLQMGYLFDLR